MESIIERMPVEILDLICSFLNHVHKPSLKALALVNRQFHHTAARFLFHSIEIKAHDPEQLEYDVLRLPIAVALNISNLEINDYCLKPGPLPDYSHDCAPQHTDGEFPHKGRYNDSFFCRSLHLWHRRRSKGLLHNVDEAWLPVANLIQQMPSLKDLTFDCQNVMPRSLFRVLLEHAQGCRLHLHNLRFTGLNEPELNQYQLELVAHPGLTSVTTDYPEYYQMGLLRHRQELAMGLLASLSGSIEALSLLEPASRVSPRSRAPEPGLGWRTVDIDHVEGLRQLKRKKVLKSIDYGCFWGLKLSHLKQWCEAIDLSRLQAMRFLSPLKFDSIEFLHHRQLPSLQRLDMAIDIFTDRSDDEQQQYERIVPIFLAALEPLVDVRLQGRIDASHIQAVVRNHGTKLKRLSFVVSDYDNQPVFDRACIEEINEWSPNIEELTIKTPRTEGDFTEVQIYRAIGAYKHLRCLFLTLDASRHDLGRLQTRQDGSQEQVMPADILSFDDFDRQVPYHNNSGLDNESYVVRKGHFRRIFINCAVDADLARAIFAQIATAKSAIGARPLQSLRLDVMGGCSLHSSLNSHVPPEWVALARHLSRSWFVEPHPRDDHSSKLVATALLSGKLRPTYAPRVLESEAQDMFRRNWPRKKKGSKGWWDDWHSFPLQTEPRE